MLRASLLFSLLASSFVPACASDPMEDELGSESAKDGEDGKGDAAAAFTYYTVTADLRACSLNTVNCGGFYVARANRSTTLCGRGTPQSRCYVGTIDWSGTAMPPSVSQSYEDQIRNRDTLIVRGSIEPGANDRPYLHATEIWVASSQEDVDGVFTLVKDNGVRCITAPCPSLTERRLNSNLSAQITSVDFSDSGASEVLIDRARDQFFDDGVIAVGYRVPDKDGGKARSANKFFTRAPVPLH